MATEEKAQRVRIIFDDCLYRQEELSGDPHSDAVIVEGVVSNFGFHPSRLISHKEEVRAILDQMPSEFHAANGGGWSFLNLCMDKDGIQWAEHQTMEQLVALGIGLGLAKYCLPRAMWGILPGGMPYVGFDTRVSKSTGHEGEDSHG